VIVFRAPTNQSQFYIKRIIGLPGESVEISNNKLYITTTSGATFMLDEPYIPKSFNTDPNIIKKLNKDEFFVLGDNRPHSSDSRIWGVLPRKNITGKALVRLWPIDEIELIKNY
ncbi:MAG: signal peptidase I, partial [Patescibacteria group bacterium]